VTKKETNFSGTLSEAVSVATSVAYTRQEIQKLKTEFVSLLEKKTAEVIVEQVPGPAGQRGAIGATGAQGAKGDKGDVGERGEKGEVGPQGNMGLDGPRGFKGDKGDIGSQGIQGITGERGEKGDKGEDGKNGLDGRDGEAGKIGPAGPAGEKGIQGERGEKGDRGDRGERGESGKDGRQGIQGSVGPRGEIGPQGIQGLPGKDGKDADVKSIEKSISQFKEVLQKDVSQYKAKVNTIISSGIGGGSHGGGEVNLRRLDDVDTSNLTDGYVLSFNETTQKFEFVAQSGGGGGTVDTFARTRANTAFTQANSAFAQANTATTLAQAAYNQANTGGGAGIDTLARTTANSATTLAQAAYNAANNVTGSLDTLARTTANSAYNQANTATTLAQAAYNQANTGGAGATESLNVNFNNSTATQYKIVALNANAQTVLATSLEISQIDRVLGVLDNVGETVTFGAITNPSWTWTPEQSLYLGSNGTIVTTSTIDGAAFSLKIGYAISSTKAFIKIGTPVVL
jgi:hypothetical protein